MTPEIGKLSQSIHSAMSVKYNMRVYDLQRQGKDVINLSLGEAFFTMPPLDFSDIPVKKGYHYSSSLGLAELRQKIGEYYSSACRIPNDWEKEILVTAGSKAAIYMALYMLTDPGDDVAVLEPAWVSYEEQIRMCRANPVMIPYTTDVSGLEKFLTPETKVIIINNPNNPSGKIFTHEELRQLMDFAEQRDLFIISDEAYNEFVPRNEPFCSIGEFDPEKKRTLIINSISKCLGMSGWRIGYVIANASYISQLLKLNTHLITCAPTLLEQYTARHFDLLLRNARDQIAELMETRAWASGAMQEQGLEYLPGNGTFYFLVSLSGSKVSSDAFATRLLEEAFVSTVPGVGYGKSVARFLRISVGSESRERMRKGFREISEMIRKCS
jgi:aminotransferase